MFHEQRLNLGRSDTKTFVFDHFFLTVDNVSVALSIDMADIACVKPAIAQRACGFFRSFPVALHDLWTANDDLAIFSVRQFTFAGFNIDDLLLSVMHGHSDAIDTH